MSTFTSRWSNAIVRYRKLVLGITLAFMALAPLTFKHLYYDNSNEVYFLEHDPNLIAYNNLLEYFGDTEYLMVGVEARAEDSDVFNPSTIQMIDELTSFLENHTLITQVRSLSKYQYTHDDGGMLATDELFEYPEELHETPETLDDAKAIMAKEKLALGSLITEDFKHTRIAARIEHHPNQNAHFVQLVDDLKTYIDKQGYEAQGFNLHLSGIPVINERFETITTSDQAVLNPLMGVAMMCILFLVFRSIFATLLPLVVIISTLFLLTAVQALLGFPTTAVNSALVPTMIILSMGASVHVLVEFFQARRKGLSPQEAAADTTRDLFFAILFTSLTTSFGFIALSITELRPVREFAILAAIGPMIIFLLAVTTLPAVLSFIPWLPRNTKHKENARVTNFLTITLPEFSKRNRKIIASVGILISAFSFYAISYIRVDTNVVNYFRESSWMNKDLEYFNENFKGISNLEVIIDTGADGGVKDPAILQRADALQSWLEAQPETGKALSILDFYKQIYQSLSEDNPAYFKLPTTPEMAAQFLLLYENTGPDEDLSDMKDFTDRYLRLSVPFINMDESKMTAALNRVEQEIATHYGDLNIELTGSMVLNHAQNVYTNSGMFQSFGIAILVIGVCFFVLFSSFKFGAIALIPSIVPVILTGGIVSFAGVAMDLGTMIVGAMTIGIAVDDAIHLMSRYRLMRKRKHSVDESIKYALGSSGRAVVLTSAILICGFSVMLFGNFIPFIYVGLFSAMIMSFALIGDLLFMPALIYLTELKNNNEETLAPSVNEQNKGAIENA
ncbi:Multidrug resistance protein MdtC [Thalassocella blandensis]|nr:Multidrug resistance protein MdtC [Thalassocella blandensis]